MAKSMPMAQMVQEAASRAQAQRETPSGGGKSQVQPSAGNAEWSAAPSTGTTGGGGKSQAQPSPVATQSPPGQATGKNRAQPPQATPAGLGQMVRSLRQVGQQAQAPEDQGGGKSRPQPQGGYVSPSNMAQQMRAQQAAAAQAKQAAAAQAQAQAQAKAQEQARLQAQQQAAQQAAFQAQAPQYQAYWEMPGGA